MLWFLVVRLHHFFHLSLVLLLKIKFPVSHSPVCSRNITNEPNNFLAGTFEKWADILHPAMAQQSQRCKVTFESSAAVPTRHYLLVGPETSRYDEVWHKVLGEYRKTEFHEGRDLASLYWIGKKSFSLPCFFIMKFLSSLSLLGIFHDFSYRKFHFFIGIKDGISIFHGTFSPLATQGPGVPSWVQYV